MEQIQELLQLPAVKLVKLYKIRWLSLEQAVKIFDEQYPALFQFFKKEKEILKTPKERKRAAEILEYYSQKWNHLYLKFLNFVLPLVNQKNLEFQSEKPKIHLTHKHMTALFTSIVPFQCN